MAHDSHCVTYRRRDGTLFGGGGGELNQPNAVAEAVEQVGRHPQTESCLARAPGDRSG